MDTGLVDRIYAVAKSDGRYHREAFVFTYEACLKTLKGLTAKDNSEDWPDGRKFCEGIRAHAECEFGFLSKTVFSVWGVSRTEDFGEILSALISGSVFAAPRLDPRHEFENVFSFDEAFEHRLIYE